MLVGGQLVSVSKELAQEFSPGDHLLGIAATGNIRRIPKAVHSLVSEKVGLASKAFYEMASVTPDACRAFFGEAARLLNDDRIFGEISRINDQDVADAQQRSRSVTRLKLSSKMRADMVQAFQMWEQLDLLSEEKLSEIHHDGWSVEEWRSPLGVIGFVFEGRPNVFADATGVLKSGNTVVFRIGSDALNTARAIMSLVIEPALRFAGLPEGAVVLLESREHSAGWSLFSDTRLALAVARGSGEAVAELGSIAQQSGISVSLHGTGGAWILVGENAVAEQLRMFVQHSLDRKVCNTVNVVCIPRSRAQELCSVVVDGANAAAASRTGFARIHCVNGAEEYLAKSHKIDVLRSNGLVTEEQFSISPESDLNNEFEWEETPEFFLVVTEDLHHAIDLCNKYSPHFVVSVISEDPNEKDAVWSLVDAPFVGDGFTRWVDGQFALLRPELGLSNWERGRLFARSGILSGDSAFTVRLRVRQTNPDLHR